MGLPMAHDSIRYSFSIVNTYTHTHASPHSFTVPTSTCGLTCTANHNTAYSEQTGTHDQPIIQCVSHSTTIHAHIQRIPKIPATSRLPRKNLALNTLAPPSILLVMLRGSDPGRRSTNAAHRIAHKECSIRVRIPEERQELRNVRDRCQEF